MFYKPKNPKIKAAFIFKVTLYLDTPTYLLKEALQMIGGRYRRAHLFWKIIEVKRMIEFILEALDCFRFKIMPFVYKEPESSYGFMSTGSSINPTGLTCHLCPMPDLMSNVLQKIP